MELSSAIIKKYSKYSPSELKALAQKYYNRFIRERDKDEKCISCKIGAPAQAGHFYSAGHYQSLRFNEDNCHGQCVRCNYFLSGNQIHYRPNLEKKIGKDRLLALDEQAIKKAYKFDRFTLINLIETYKLKSK